MSQRNWIVVRLAAVAMQVSVVIAASDMELSARVVANMLAGAAHVAVIVWHHWNIAKIFEAEERVCE